MLGLALKVYTNGIGIDDGSKFELQTSQNRTDRIISNFGIHVRFLRQDGT